MKTLQDSNQYKEAKKAFDEWTLKQGHAGSWPTVDLTNDMVVGEAESTPEGITFAVVFIACIILLLGLFFISEVKAQQSPFHNTLPPSYNQQTQPTYGQDIRRNTAVQAELAEYLARRNAEASFGYTPPTQNYGSSNSSLGQTVYDALMQKTINDSVDSKMQNYGR